MRSSKLLLNSKGADKVTGPLAGLRVVDLTGSPAGIRSSAILADYGADVVWVEPPGGSPVRQRYPVECAVFCRGKRSIIADLRDGAGVRDVSRLLETADVMLEDWSSASIPPGFDHQTLRERAPALITVSVTGFGRTTRHSDLPNEEALVHALVGTMAEQIGLREGPIFEGLPFGSIGAAYLAVIGTLAALWARNRDGVGRSVETSVLDGALAYHAMFWGDNDANPDSRAGTQSDNDFLVGGSNRLICGSFLCADEHYISVHTGAVGAFGRLMKVLGLDDRIGSSEAGLDMGIPLTPAETAILHTEIHTIFATDTVEAWERRLLDADVCGIPALPPGEVFDQPQVRFNQMIVTVEDPELGSVEQVAPAVKYSATPAVCTGPAPAVGSSTAGEVHTAWTTQTAPWCGDQAPVEGPLLGDVHIIDAGAFFAGPYASRLLAELGADVIKLETTGGDPLRGLERLFRTAQAGKRSLAINLKDPGLLPALHELIKWADVVHHNMRPGAAERIGIGPEQVAEVNPTAIYGHAPGWGSAGPNALRQSFEPMMSGYVGANFEVAGQFNPPLYPAGNADPGNGLLGAVAMLSALLHRARTGCGQRFENAQLNATLAHVAHIIRTADGQVLNALRLDPLQLGFGALERLYETMDGWICIVAHENEQVGGLGHVLGLDLLSDERFASRESRAANDYELADIIDDAIRKRRADELVEALQKAGVGAANPAGYQNVNFMQDPEARRLGRVAEVPHPKLGNVREIALLVRVSDTDQATHRLAPDLGQHTAEILRDLGYDEHQLVDLSERGAIVVG